ncbi:AIPR family protein [Carboxydochorda subterranea]|uniref:AIPR family protein n=1 Tax=Carboxydichorda subterranea TaxID=3109565 RepID=A0ABZ1C0W7_9FIRM|nr:AIPR family protein [Limnochorda sp. L945t]WRP18730.1 AIPR family protein [Limnochorda sp. L945t]
MSVLHLRHVRLTLERLFKGVLDMSDCQHHSGQLYEFTFLSRALAAYSVMYHAQCDVSTAANSVIDGYDDNGLDAVHYDELTRTLWIVQAKWIDKGKGAPSLADVKKFTSGVRDLINGNFDRFNEQLQKRQDELMRALDDVQVNLGLIIAYTGGPMHRHGQRDLEDLLGELNDASPVAKLVVFTLSDIHRAVAGLAESDSVNFEIALSEWGQVREPYRAFYGQANAAEIAKLWAFGPRLLSKNIRKFLGDSSVNESIQETLRTRPDDFWYFNNGITILCSSVEKKLMGGASRDVGIFVCNGANVVNGAQTVGSIARVYQTNPESVERARVLVRLISLENCPEGYATELTRATNTQNRIEKRDFVSLDPQQERLRMELYIEGKTYSYKTGDALPDEETGCTLDEATVALACSSGDLSLAILAKKEIGKLWEDTTQPPYATLFNENLTGAKLWRLVQILRAVESELKSLQADARGKYRNVAVHGNRFILYQVFKRLPVAQLEDPAAPIGDLLEQARQLTRVALDATYASVEALFPDAMIGRLFYNLTKCRRIDEDLNDRLPPSSRWVSKARAAIDAEGAQTGAKVRSS